LSSVLLRGKCHFGVSFLASFGVRGCSFGVSILPGKREIGVYIYAREEINRGEVGSVNKLTREEGSKGNVGKERRRVTGKKKDNR